MMNKVVTNINIYCLLLHYTNSQYSPQVYGGIQHVYQYPYQSVSYPQYSNQRIYENYENNKGIQENYEDYNDYADENCACDKCEETITKPLCRDVCPNCFATPPPVLAPSYVFLPFPYPYPITLNSTLAPVTQTVETTTTSTVVNTVTATTKEITAKMKTERVNTLTSEAVTLSSAFPEDSNDILRDKTPLNFKDKGQFTLTALRRTKPNWLPKYGIVPISDKFAEKLMLQLRSMKVLHPQRDNI